MKFGKEFQQILEDPSLPAEWKSSAIEYGRLKKIIKDVVAELSSMGLSPDVLHKLLVTEEEGVKGVETAGSGLSEISEGTQRRHSTSVIPGGLDRRESIESQTTDGDSDDSVIEFEFESDEGSPSTPKATNPKSPTTKAWEPLEVVLAPASPKEDDNAEAGPSNHAHHHKTFRVRLLSDSEPSVGPTPPSPKMPLRPMGVMDMMTFQADKERRASERAERNERMKMRRNTDTEHSEKRGRRVTRRAVMDKKGAVKAEYILVGDPGHMTPQLRLHLSAGPSLDPKATPSGQTSDSSRSASQSSTQDSSDQGNTTTDSEDDLVKASDREAFTRSILAESPMLRTPKLRSKKSPCSSRMGMMPSSPSMRKFQQAVSPIWALASGNSLSEGLNELSLGDAAPSDQTTPRPIDIERMDSVSTPSAVLNGLGLSSSPSRERDFIIPLSSDMQFFSLLTAALASLSAFHAAQQVSFRNSVERLCTSISESIQPGNSSSIHVLPTPFTPFTAVHTIEDESATKTSLIQSSSSGGKLLVRQGNGKGKGKSSKEDLYAWREIFTLWIEHEIFESTAERTRGERTVEEAEKRLGSFANEVVKRGLGDRRSMKGKKVRESWEEFLRLNVLLLDLKRFQVANINAARKILKKHDKRTALTASSGFPSFVRSTLSAQVDRNGNISTWTFYNTSLPHVLLASLTDTLLPILPSLDDYACLICTTIAFKPIRLDCGHLFCVRCLVKMQRAGKSECPLCRSKVVLLADKNSLDLTVMNFMKDWFPKEVKEKQRENELEIASENAGVSGTVVKAKKGKKDEKCVIM